MPWVAPTGEQPWYQIGLVTGLFAFAAVLLAQLVTVSVERARARREDRSRWHAERREVYARFVSCYNDAAKLLYDRWPDEDSLDIARFNEYDLFMQAHMELYLLASSTVRDASDRLKDMLDELCVVASAADRQDRQWEIFDKSHTVRRAFFDAARKELDVRD